MVGSGRATIAEVCDMSRANVADGLYSKALQGLSSLGGSGKHDQNQERDLHRWVKGMHGMTLEPFEITMELNASWLDTFKQVSSFPVFPPLFPTVGHLVPFEVPGKKGVFPQTVPMLLPHELLDATWRAGAVQDSSGESYVWSN